MRTDLGTPCRICGLLREHCEAANRHVAHRYGHVYEPSTPKSVQLVARPAIEQARQAAPRGWRHPAPPPCPPPTLFGDAE